MMRWRNGYAVDCKLTYPGSTPGRISKITRKRPSNDRLDS
jgi:hypothetical protein